MRTEVVMPQMGESVAEGTVTAWLKEIGDHVDRDEPLFEITTDKVDAEVPSPVSGKVVQWLIEPGSTVEINTVIAIVDTDGDSAAVEAPASTPSDAPTSPTPAAAPIAPSATSAAASGRVNAGVGAIDGLKPSSQTSADELQRTRSTPLVRRIAAEHGIQDLSGIAASGRNGRVTKQDIMAFIEQGGPAAQQQSAQSRPAPQAPSAPQRRQDIHLPPIQVGERDTLETMTPQRMAIAKHMIASRATSAHAHTIHEIDFGNVVRARQQLKADFESRGVKLTFTAFMIQAVGQALSEFPIVNSSIDGDQIVYRGDINVGVAVALNDSLIVPVVRNVDELSLLGVARQIDDLAVRARTKRLKPDEVRGGTFTLSNHGIFGPEFGVPVINQPQVAIISTGAIKKRVVVDQRTDAIMVRPTAIFCMSFDHRVIDGATADRFLARIRQIIETWSV